MAKVLGIDVGGQEVHGILLEGTAKKFTITGYASAPISPAPDDPTQYNLAEALKQVVTKLGGPKDASAIAVSAEQCSFRNIVLPFVDEEQIRKVIKFELEGYIHQWNIDDVVVDFYSIAQEKGQSQLLSIVAPKDYLRQLLGACQSAGFDPNVADLDAMALYNAALASGTMQPEGAFILLHVRETNALLAVVENHKLKLVRSIRTASTRQEAQAQENTQIPAPATAAESSQAANEKTNAPVESWEEVFVTLEDEPQDANHIPHLIVREIVRSLLAIRFEGALSGILISGLWAQIEGLPEKLANVLRQSVMSLDAVSSEEHTLNETELQQAATHAPIAFGAALKLIDIDAGKVDLRQEDVRYTRKFDQIKTPLLTLMSILAFLLLMENLYYFKRNGVLDRQLEYYWKVAQDEANLRAETQYQPNPNLEKTRWIPSLTGKVSQKLNELKKEVGTGGQIEMWPSAFEGWRLLFIAIQEKEADIGKYLVELIKARSVERRGDKSARVEIDIKFVFLGDASNASSAIDRLERYFREKGWEVIVGKTEEVDGGGGTAVNLTVTVNFPSGTA